MYKKLVLQLLTALEDIEREAGKKSDTALDAEVSDLIEDARRTLNEDDGKEYPLLGLATTKELLEEVMCRIEMDGKLDYKTVDDFE